MTIQQLKYIVTIADKGTISEAAKSLFVSQPSLTNSIKDLENELQITIFNRTNKGVDVTNEGQEFLGYARQVLDQMNLLEERFLNGLKQNPRFSVSTQHYSFAVNAFVDFIHQFGYDKYDFTLRETQTYEIIEDVSKLKSEIGILYLSSKNKEVISNILKQRDLVFEELFTVNPHIFISSKHPLANNEIIKMEQLKDYPYLTYEQGEHNSFYFSEEILPTFVSNKNIKVGDRATLFNLAIGLNGYTVCTGVISKELNGESIISRPLDIKDYITLGIITKKNIKLSRYGKAYIEALKSHSEQYNMFTI